MTGTEPRRLKGNLPAETTSFVGRRREITTTRCLLSTTRLVTLTGVGGVGKTRLALQIAARVQAGFPDGVWLVELAALTDDKLLTQALTDVLGIQDQSARPLLDTLSDYLAAKRLLLVLDNCEHLVDACAMLADRLLRAAPELRVLATSRHALRTAGEHLLEVAPLPTPDLPRATSPTRYAAVRLFAERAATALPGFRVNAGNHDTIARICRRLDGIPLAIELAAVRVRALPVDRILRRLDDYFDFLAEGSRICVPRLRTLHATFDWSFDLCSFEDQDMWARASEFIGGFDLDAAEAVCAGEGIASEAVLDLVDRLVDKSILTRVNSGGATVRWRMLEPIRQYGQERLASSGLRTIVRTRHRDYYWRLAEHAERAWLGPEELDTFTQLQREHANLRAALEFCLTEPGEQRAGLAIGTALWNYWFLSCSHTEGRYWLDRALEANPEHNPTRAKALWVNAWLAVMQADAAAGRSMTEECRRVAQRLGDESALGHATRVTGVATFLQNDVPGGGRLLKDALIRLRRLGERSGIWITLLQLTVATATLGRPEQAVAYGEECLAMSDSRAHLSRSWALWALAIGRWLTGDRQSAGTLVREGIRINQPSNQWGLAHGIEMLAWIAAAEGRYRRAAGLLGVAAPIWRATGVLPSTFRYLALSHGQCERQIRQSLGDEEFATVFREGTRLTTDEAIAYALEPQRH
ncbi:AAA family ATPase [Kibdelosporangium philippinense]|uniref:AAA family ATPase n=1 Tax=Kibdelosporangium philippinense TaxID=211113 RepID=A0ABS8ZIS3_9PSEU|nr:AAA family ATPase [Kibdelosporangium philippinense]MCE7007018.1 AAA family ATPase [Kibdelosporangium philippinense]